MGEAKYKNKKGEDRKFGKEGKVEKKDEGKENRVGGKGKIM